MELFGDFLNNTTLLLSLAVLYALARYLFREDNTVFRAAMGLLFGLVAVAGMLVPVHLMPGVIFDGRSIVVGTAGAIGGPLSGLVAAAVASAFRLQVGGVGSLTGVGTILTSALLGILYQRLAAARPALWRPLPLLGLALAVHVVVLAWMLTLPGDLAARVLASVTLPVLLVFPPAMVLLILLLRLVAGAIDNERRLEASEAKYRLLVENQTDMIVKVDNAGRFEFVSPSYCETFDREEKDLLGKTFMPLVHADDRAATEAAMRDLQRPPFRCYMEQRAWTARGWRWLAWSDAAVLDAAGRVTGVIGAGRDVTDRKHAEQERDALLEHLGRLTTELDRKVRLRTAELEAANAELESFAYTVSHDLRAPTRAIAGFERALREDFGPALPAGALEHLDEIALGAQRMNALIEGLLDLSRSSRGTLEVVDTDLGELARDAHRELARSHPGRSVGLRLDGDLRARGDPRLLRTLMQNLLENAWKYTTGVADALIEVQRVGVGADVCFCVSDNGAGFDPAFAHRLFEPFQRLHRHDEYPGIGIGLATCARIVRRHGGDIAGCGRVGAGARFCFGLPFECREEDAHGPEKSAPRRG